MFVLADYDFWMSGQWADHRSVEPTLLQAVARAALFCLALFA